MSFNWIEKIKSFPIYRTCITGFPLCIIMCLLTPGTETKSFPHCSHLCCFSPYGLYPEWAKMCLLRREWRTKTFPQILHSHCFNPAEMFSFRSSIGIWLTTVHTDYRLCFHTVSVSYDFCKKNVKHIIIGWFNNFLLTNRSWTYTATNTKENAFFFFFLPWLNYWKVNGLLLKTQLPPAWLCPN